MYHQFNYGLINDAESMEDIVNKTDYFKEIKLNCHTTNHNEMAIHQ